MKPFVWRNRLVKLLDETTWAMSRAGDHEDFDYYPIHPDDDMAVAGTCGMIPENWKVDPGTGMINPDATEYRAEKILDMVAREDGLVFVCEQHYYLLSGERWVTGSPCLTVL